MMRKDVHIRQLVIFFGLTAAGKSHLATAFARKYGCPYFNTDVIRKALAGVEPTTSVSHEVESGLYSRDRTRQTYHTLLQVAKKSLEERDVMRVVVDGSFLLETQRMRFIREFGANYNIKFILCDCVAATRKQRLSARGADPAAISDGSWEIYLHQKNIFKYPGELPGEQLLELDTDAPVEYLMGIIERFLGIDRSPSVT